MDGPMDPDDPDHIDNVVTRSRGATYASTEREVYRSHSKSDGDRDTKTSHLLTLLGALRHCNKAKDLDEAVSCIVKESCAVLGCDRATLFMVDEVQEELVIRQAVGAKHIRIPWTAGIAGDAFTNGKRLNIPNVYEDPRFSKETDIKTGYRTESILAAPIPDADGVTVAVLQAINKKRPLREEGEEGEGEEGKEGAGEDEGKAGAKRKDSLFQGFTSEDEFLFDQLAVQVGIILRNAMLKEETKRSHEQVISLLDIVRSLHSNMGINSLMFTITERSPGLVDADRCTLYLVDRRHNELFTLQGAVEIRIPISKGLAGACAISGDVVNVADAHKDDRFDTAYDNKSGYRTKSVLVMPIRNMPQDGSEQQVVGVLQMINKLHGGDFTPKDERLLGSFLDIAGAILNTSQLFHSATKKLSEFEMAQDVSHKTHKSSKQMALEAPAAIAECDEEEEEEDEEDY